MTADMVPAPARTGHVVPRIARGHQDNGPDACDTASYAEQTALGRLRRELHDQVGSSLAGITLQVEAAYRLIEADPSEARRILADAHSDATALVGQVRRIASNRDTAGPRPAGPGGCSIGTALRRIVQQMNRAVAGVEIKLELDDRLGTVRDDTASTAFWIVREALANMLKHSSARHCAVTLTMTGDDLRVRVVDDGVGIPPSRRCAGSGLLNMAERAAERGGWCTVESCRPQGAVITAHLPLETVGAM